jgi:hypothetical protein
MTYNTRMDFSGWPQRKVSVISLKLDPANPRLAGSIGTPTQRELIEDLFEHEAVADLARDIARSGYYPTETLLAYKDGGKTIVAEGNRRLAALKVLHNPELAPTKLVKRIKTYAAKAVALPTSVLVAIAPSRDATLPIVVARHKGESIRGWSPIMQAGLVARELDAGSSVEDIALSTGLEKGEVARSFRDARLYDVIRSLDLKAHVATFVSNPRTFPYTNVRRLIEFSAIADVLKFKQDPKKGFVTELPADDFKKCLQQIVNDIAEGDVNSRSHNTKEEAKEYAERLRKLIEPTKRGRGRPKKTEANAMIDPAKATSTATRRKPATRAPRQPTGVVPRSFTVAETNDRIEAIVRELKRLKPLDYPNAVSVLLRSLLDMSVASYLSNHNLMQEVKEHYGKKDDGKKKASWQPSLNQCLQWILNHDADNKVPLQADARKALQKFITDSKHSLTLDSLNWFTHNRYTPPTEEQLRSFWQMLYPIFELTIGPDMESK